jgi:HlyD family secretion protein
MRRIVPVLVIAAAAALFWFRDYWLPAAADQGHYLGYAEGETSLVGPVVAGRLVTIAVIKGQEVKAGAPLFQLDDAVARSEILRLEASLAAARAALDDLQTGKRPEELDLIARQEAEAEANLALAKTEHDRVSGLSRRGIVAQTEFDKAKADLAVAEERLKQVQANATIARLPARVAEITAAQARVAEAEAALATQRARLQDYQAVSPFNAVVDDVFFDAGETVGAGQPVVSILQGGKIRLLFYVPEAERAKATIGTTIRYSCDGCGEGGSATITHVAATPEYTPPVIYSETARAKLVFLVEASPDQPDPRLQPGLPIEIEALP